MLSSNQIHMQMAIDNVGCAVWPNLSNDVQQGYTRIWLDRLGMPDDMNSVAQTMGAVDTHCNSMLSPAGEPPPVLTSSAPPVGLAGTLPAVQAQPAPLMLYGPVSMGVISGPERAQAQAEQSRAAVAAQASQIARMAQVQRPHYGRCFGWGALGLVLGGGAAWGVCMLKARKNPEPWFRGSSLRIHDLAVAEAQRAGAPRVPTPETYRRLAQMLGREPTHEERPYFTAVYNRIRNAAAAA